MFKCSIPLHLPPKCVEFSPNFSVTIGVKWRALVERRAILRCWSSFFTCQCTMEAKLIAAKQVEVFTVSGAKLLYNMSHLRRFVSTKEQTNVCRISCNDSHQLGSTREYSGVLAAAACVTGARLRNNFRPCSIAAPEFDHCCCRPSRDRRTFRQTIQLERGRQNVRRGGCGRGWPYPSAA